MLHPLEKRLKRHVIGKDHDFFAVTSPNGEALLGEELTALGLKCRTLPGGAAFRGRLQEAYRANLYLRSASRVLMRVHAFRAAAFRSLEKAVSQFAWELFIPAGTPPRLHVATHHCRLPHTDAIAERVAAIHLLAAAQACDIRADIKARPLLARALGDIRQVSDPVIEDRPLDEDIERMCVVIRYTDFFRGQS